MTPLKLVLPAHYKGDSWKGFSLDSITIDGSVPTVALASCRLQFRSKTGVMGFEYNSVADSCKGLITIDTAATWAVTLNAAILNLDAGMWVWDLEMTDVHGVVITVLTGRLRIKADITYR